MSVHVDLRFHDLLEAIPNAMILVDRDGRIVQVNTQTESLFGYTREELLGQAIEALVPGGFHARFEDSDTHPTRVDIDLGARHKDGREIPVEISLSRLGTGDDLLVVGSIRDVTQRKRGEQASRASEARLRALLESTRAIPWEASAKTWQFTYVGPQALELLGYPIEQWYEKDFWTSHIHPDDRKFAVVFCLESSARTKDYEFDYRMITSSGNTVWLHDVVSVGSVNGTPETLRGFMIDITERKLDQERLRDLSGRLIHAQEEERRRIAREDATKTSPAVPD